MTAFWIDHNSLSSYDFSGPGVLARLWPTTPGEWHHWSSVAETAKLGLTSILELIQHLANELQGASRIMGEAMNCDVDSVGWPTLPTSWHLFRFSGLEPQGKRGQTQRKKNARIAAAPACKCHEIEMRLHCADWKEQGGQWRLWARGQSTAPVSGSACALHSRVLWLIAARWHLLCPRLGIEKCHWKNLRIFESSTLAAKVGYTGKAPAALVRTDWPTTNAV